MSCHLQLDRYQIESVAVILNEQYNRKLKSHTGDLTANMTVKPHNEDARKFMLVLEVMTRPTKKHEAQFFPYNVAVKGRGFFRVKKEMERAEAEKLLRLNGASILYGLLRAQVAQITAQGVHGQFLLPTVNFVEMDEQAKKTAPPSEPEKGRKRNSPAGAKKSKR